MLACHDQDIMWEDPDTDKEVKVEKNWRDVSGWVCQGKGESRCPDEAVNTYRHWKEGLSKARSPVLDGQDDHVKVKRIYWFNHKLATNVSGKALKRLHKDVEAKRGDLGPGSLVFMAHLPSSFRYS